MSLDLDKLEKVRVLANGERQARCPACAESGQDRSGEHLRIYPDGRFGCCVHPKDREHRKRIFALAGEKSSRTFNVKVLRAESPFPAARSVKDSLRDCLRTLRTPVSQSESSEQRSEEDLRTLRTPILKSRAYAREDNAMGDDDTLHTCKDNEKGVLSVLAGKEQGRLPYLTPNGTLIIPFDSPELFHWWKGGQSVRQTLTGLNRKETPTVALLANAKEDA